MIPGPVSAGRRAAGVRVPTPHPGGTAHAETPQGAKPDAPSRAIRAVRAVGRATAFTLLIVLGTFVSAFLLLIALVEATAIRF